MVGLILLMIAISTTIAWMWAGGLIYMEKYYKNYKGEDFLNWKTDKEDEEQIL